MTTHALPHLQSHTYIILPAGPHALGGPGRYLLSTAGPSLPGNHEQADVGLLCTSPSCVSPAKSVMCVPSHVRETSVPTHARTDVSFHARLWIESPRPSRRFLGPFDPLSAAGDGHALQSVPTSSRTSCFAVASISRVGGSYLALSCAGDV